MSGARAEGWLRTGVRVLAETEAGGVRLLAPREGEPPRAALARLAAAPGVLRAGLAQVFEVQEAAP